MSDDLKDKAEQLVDRLKHERDELRVRLHLLKADLLDEWEEVESKWEHVETRLEHLRADAKNSAEDIGTALGQLGEEIAHAYRRFRDSLK